MIKQKQILHLLQINNIDVLYIFIILNIGIIFACSNSRHNNMAPLILNTELQHAFLNIKTTLTIKRSPLIFATGQTVNDCSSYLELRSRGKIIEETVNNMMMAADYIICDSVDVIKHADFSHPVVFSDENRGEILATRLDLRSFLSSLRPKLDKDQFVLSSLGFPMQTLESGLTIDTSEWFFRLEVVAIGDFDLDGKTDWLIWMIDESKKGNYRNYQLLMIPSAESSGLLMAKKI